uniref:Uncharacterized protein n=1 Tax=Anguilla anguilla TaxID=7936 RepID=A0A0E9PC81_ANGAN
MKMCYFQIQIDSFDFQYHILCSDFTGCLSAMSQLKTN